jgi:hypothetical protein
LRIIKTYRHCIIKPQVWSRYKCWPSNYFLNFILFLNYHTLIIVGDFISFLLSNS